MVMNIVDRAIELALSGLHVFPCANPSKAPTCLTGFKAATSDPDTVRALWHAHPGDLIGVRTGTASNINVLDLDAKHPEAQAWLDANSERLPNTRVHRTRSGGLHLLFRHRDGFRCSTSRIATGVDTRGDGGYVIWWPPHGYEIVINVPLADAPDWLIEALKPADVVPIPSSRAHRIAGMRGLALAIVRAREGERNSVTFWAACRAGEMVRDGFITAETAISLIVEAAIMAGLPGEEALKTAQSGLRVAGIR
jgi:hypothetical protein